MVKSVSPPESSLWLVDLLRGAVSPFSTMPGRNDSPVWSRDGKRVVGVGSTGTMEFVVKMRTMPGRSVLFSSSALFKNPADWSPDGRWIAMTQLDSETAQNVYVLDALGKQPPTLVASSPVRDNAGAISSDGKWLLYSSQRAAGSSWGRESVPRARPARRDFAGRRHRRLVERRRPPDWCTGTKTCDAWWRVDVTPTKDALVVGAARKFATLPPHSVWLAVMPDLKRFIGIAPERTGTGSVTVVRNCAPG